MPKAVNNEYSSYLKPTYNILQSSLQDSEIKQCSSVQQILYCDKLCFFFWNTPQVSTGNYLCIWFNISMCFNPSECVSTVLSTHNAAVLQHLVANHWLIGSWNYTIWKKICLSKIAKSSQSKKRIKGWNNDILGWKIQVRTKPLIVEHQFPVVHEETIESLFVL